MSPRSALASAVAAGTLLVLVGASRAPAALFWNHGLRSKNISVCFVGDSLAKNPTFAGLVQDYMGDFERAANIRFDFLGACPAATPLPSDPTKDSFAGDLRIILPGVTTVNPFGLVPGDGCPPDPNFLNPDGTYNGKNDGWGSWANPPDELEVRRSCVYNVKLGDNGDTSGVPWRSHTLHEVGHALGLSHEHARSDVPPNACGIGGSASSEFLTPYDRDSVMHYEFLACGIHGNYSQAGFSAWDRLALRILYPEDNRVAEFTGRTMIRAGEWLSLQSLWQAQGALVATVAKDFRWYLNGSLVSTQPSLNVQLFNPGTYSLAFTYSDNLTGIPARSYAYNGTVRVLTSADYDKLMASVGAAQALLDAPASFGPTDLAVTASDAPDPIVGGQKLTYVVTVENLDAVTATGVKVTANLPAAGATLSSAVPSQGSCTVAYPTLTCSLGNIDQGDLGAVTIELNTLAAGARTLTTSVSAKSDRPDPDPSNNSRTIATAVLVAGIDLLETALASPPTNVGPGVAFPLQDSARNQGGTTAGASTTRYYLSPDTAKSVADAPVGSRSVPSLSGGSTSTATASLTAAPAPPAGVYYVLACADADNAVAEVNESNNCRSSASTVTLSAAVDLTVSALSNPPAATQVGATFAAQDTVWNQGNLATAAVAATRFYLSKDRLKDNADVLLAGDRKVSSGLAANGTSAGSANVTVPAGTSAGAHYLLACADGASAVGESNEGNNCRSSTSTTTVASGPDLVESALGNPPATTAPGGSFKFGETGKNQGNAATTGGTTTRYYLSANRSKDAGDLSLVGSRTLPAGFAPGASSWANVSVTVPSGAAAGAYYLIACADADSTQSETNETNNCRASAGTTQVAGGPDLVDSALGSPPAATAPGGGFKFGETVKNQGNAATTLNTVTRYYLSADKTKDSGDLALTGSRTVAAGFAPNTSSWATVSVTVPSGTAAGAYYLVACADADSKQAETNETNNCRASAGTTQVASGPDLVESALGNPPATAAPGGSFKFGETVKNQGNAPTRGDAVNRYYLSADRSKDPADVLLTGSRLVAAGMAPNASSWASVAVTLPLRMAAGSYYLIACADADSTLVETAEDNNCRASASPTVVSP